MKGEDLLFLDHANNRLSESERDRYAAMGLPAGPFASVAIYAPPRRGDPNAGPDVATRNVGVDTYYWTLEEFVRQELLPFAFVEPEDERHQYTMLIHWVTAKLLRDGMPHGDDGAWEIEGTVLRTYGELVDLVVESSPRPDLAAAGYPNWHHQRVHSPIAVIAACSLGHLIRADIPIRPRHTVRTSDAQVTVVDLHNLPDRAKRFVVGVTVKRAFDEKEASGAARPLLVPRARRTEQVRAA